MTKMQELNVKYHELLKKEQEAIAKLAQMDVAYKEASRELCSIQAKIDKLDKEMFVLHEVHGVPYEQTH